MKRIEEKLGYTFKNKNLLLQAFTRRSFTNENDEWENNEVLEFIGDTMLGMVIVKKMMLRYGAMCEIWSDREEKEQIWSAFKHTAEECNEWFHSYLSEKSLSEMKINLVKGETLAAAIEKTGMQDRLVMSKGDIKNGVMNESSVKEDLFEAIIGAVTVDCGWDVETVSGVIDSLMSPDEMIEGYFGADTADYFAEISKWNMLIYGKKVKYNIQHFPERLIPYVCTIDIGDGISEICFEGCSKNEEGAKTMAAWKAWKFVCNRKELRKRIEEVIGSPEREKAIQQLNILYQKGIISEPKYIFHESDEMKSETGNPMWICDCIIEGYLKNYGYTAETKIDAKKDAAFEALFNLSGIYVCWENAEKK